MFSGLRAALSLVPASARMIPQRKKGEPTSGSPFERGFAEGLACLAPLFNIAVPLNLGLAGDCGIPLVHLLLSFLASNAVSFLDFPDQLIALTVDDIEIIIDCIKVGPL